MSRLLDDDLADGPQPERELTLSTGAILAIFLGLVLLCGVFFGFGYNLGRKSTSVSATAVPAASTETDDAAPAKSTFDNFRSSPAAPVSAPPLPASVDAKKPAAREDAADDDDGERATATPARVAVKPSASSPAPAPASSVGPAVTPGGAFVVQIAAISTAHKGDADLLAGALRHKGYDVGERSEPQDKLIHIQVGPFGTKADADAMRQRLAGDGYNAIVK
jgi:cell division septation protein DedD